MAERRVLIKSFAPRYRKKGKKVKGEVLTQFTQMTGYNRCYGAYLLRHQGKRIWLSPKVVAVGDIRKKAGGQRARKYDQKVLKALKIIWEILDYLCGKRQEGRSFLLTVNGWLTSPTSQVGTRSTCGRTWVRVANGRSRPRAVRSQCGRETRSFSIETVTR